jgi:hypothetical protein
MGTEPMDKAGCYRGGSRIPPRYKGKAHHVKIHMEIYYTH